jgi:hypothetical protein
MMAMPRTPPISAAGQQLGLGSLLADQVSTETDELRRKRLAQMAGRADLAGGNGGRAALASPIGQYFGLGRV